MKMFAGVALVVCAGVGVGMTGVGQQTSMEPMQEHHDRKPAAPSKSLVVTVNGKTAMLSVADLQAMPQRTITVHNGHSNVDETYTGVGLSDLLEKYGMTLKGDGAQKIYHSYVRAEGTDNYWVLYSASELEFGLHIGDSIVAVSMDGKPLSADGDFKMVSADEKRPARWVRNLKSLTVVTLP